jgi:hypothetical protein
MAWRRIPARGDACVKIADFARVPVPCIDVLWFRLSKKAGESGQILGHLGRDKIVVTIDRTDYWQCAYVIGKGGIGRVHAEGLEAFKGAVADGARFLADRVDELKSFDDIKLLSVSVDRLSTWSKPGLLCIGDAAHAMSPVKVIQAMQVAVHNRVLKPIVSGSERALTVPWPLKALNASTWLRCWPAQGPGSRPTP